MKARSSTKGKTMRKLVKLVVLALAGLGANSIYTSYRETIVEKHQDRESTDQSTSPVSSVS